MLTVLCECYWNKSFGTIVLEVGGASLTARMLKSVCQSRRHTSFILRSWLTTCSIAGTGTGRAKRWHISSAWDDKEQQPQQWARPRPSATRPRVSGRDGKNNSEKVPPLKCQGPNVRTPNEELLYHPDRLIDRVMDLNDSRSVRSHRIYTHWKRWWWWWWTMSFRAFRFSPLIFCYVWI